ncbi:undecaprenyldiphospho-muramoylpentapeptide beta-N-acetylglucosaminyltransferase [soil metagenome]
MTFAIAAAGTGGHVFPGLAVGEALVAAGVDRTQVLFVGGDRLEATVYPESGFPFLGVELAGLQRRLSLANLALPAVVARAVASIGSELAARRVAVLLGLGGYVTVPAGLAARRRGTRLAIAEQNADAGLANRFMARLAERVFTAFPSTHGLSAGEWVGNPIRRPLATFERAPIRDAARAGFGLTGDSPVVGVFGGSLGAGAVNAAVASMIETWRGPPVQFLHLAGRGGPEMKAAARVSPIRWVVLDFCDEMDHFYAASDLVIARAGGSVAELTATSTPSILVPGGFGSGGHQAANARALAGAGAAVIVTEDEFASLPGVVSSLVTDAERLSAMATACSLLARPRAAESIAEALIEMARP